MLKNRKIIIVGGGAGGLELVARLCNKFKSRDAIEIILIDKQLKHIWKPFYHQVAAGTLNDYREAIDYITYAYKKGFKFIAGEVRQINRQNKWIAIDPLFNENNENNENKNLFSNIYRLEYDILVLALGSEVNDFNIPGVKEHGFFLDSLPQAETCNKALLKHIILSAQHKNNCIAINIVGGGATGVEVAAEFNHTLSKARKYYKVMRSPTYDFKITVIEAGSRLLGMLPERISHAVSHYLHAHNINILTRTKITAVKKDGLITSDGKFIASVLTVWAAGIKGNTANILHDLEVNKINQFMVKLTLQTTKDDGIFAFGDCASCPQTDNKGQFYVVPPRAQAAHQQADFLLRAIVCYLQNKPLPVYKYRDYGSLISLSRHNVVGNLMGRVGKNLYKNLYIEGWLARLAYGLLYKKHLWLLNGIAYIVLGTLADLFMQKQRPDIKLH